MNAITLLDQQHDEVEKLFERVGETNDPSTKEALFEQIADALAMHATIEEKIFYPAAKAKQTRDILLESVEEHLQIKRTIADLLDLEPTDESFEAKLTVLQEEVEHHVEEERSDMFPKIKKLLDDEQLEALGQEMQALMAELEGTEARYSVRNETEEAASLG